jgi:hypothetical protein
VKQEQHFLQDLAGGGLMNPGNSPFLSVGAALASPFPSSPVDKDVELPDEL